MAGKGLIVRTWPNLKAQQLRPGIMDRPHVFDNLPKWEIFQADLLTSSKCLPAFSEYDGVLIVEWDIAVTPCDLELMLDEGLRRDCVVIAPYRYGQDTTHEPANGWVWAHGTGKMIEQGAPRLRAKPGDTSADWFGFGCTYIPSRLALKFLAQPRELPPTYSVFTDTNFCIFCQEQGEKAHVMWGVLAAHLHGEVRHERTIP